MRYTTNLNIIIKSIEKASQRVSRDFIELENLQSNFSSATKFAKSCYERIKKVLIEDLTMMRPEYDIFFSDGDKIIRGQNSEYSYSIFVVDGFENLRRSNPDFAISIALQHSDKNAVKETISVAVFKVIGSELFYAEKGFGCYLNNRRLRVSKKSNTNISSIVVSSEIIANHQQIQLLKDFESNFYNLNYGSKTLEIAYFSASRIDHIIFKNDILLNPFFLLAKETGASIEIKNDIAIISSQ